MTEETAKKWKEVGEKLKSARDEAQKSRMEQEGIALAERQINTPTITVEEIFGLKNVMIGMKIPVLDIRPPQILIRQKMSDENAFIDSQGKRAELGQYFHTGKMEIMDAFDCNFVYVAKGKFINKRKNNEEWDKFTTIGVMKNDANLFGMVFKSTALYAMSSLFTAVQAQKKPMFSFNIKMEVKKLEGDQGTWYIPVVRVGAIETDTDRLIALYKLARKYNMTADINLEDENE